MPLIGAPRRPEIDQSAIKFLIGLIALLLAPIEFAITSGSITSISASFWFDPGLWPRNIFVGFLFAISAFLLTYNGMSETEILADFPQLTRDDVRACLAYAAERERRTLSTPAA